MTSIIAFENDNGIIIGSDTMVVSGNYVDTRNKYVEISKDVYIFVSGNAAALDAVGFIYGQEAHEKGPGIVILHAMGFF